MTLLKTFRLAVCFPVVAVVLFSSTVAPDKTVLLHEKNYHQNVGITSADAPLFRDFYVVIANSQRRTSSSKDVVVAPFETPPLSDGFSGSFIFDANEPSRSEFASRVTHSDRQTEADGLRLYVGLAPAPDDPFVATFDTPETTLGQLDALVPGSTLAFVRFDINEWRISGGVVSYDMNISYWGKPAPGTDASEGAGI